MVKLKWIMTCAVLKYSTAKNTRIPVNSLALKLVMLVILSQKAKSALITSTIVPIIKITVSANLVTLISKKQRTTVNCVSQK